MKMEEKRNDAAAPGSQEQSQQKPAVYENNVVKENHGDLPPATGEHRARAGSDGDNCVSLERKPVASGHGQQESSQSHNIPGPRNLPLSKYWKPEIVPMLEQHPEGSIKPPGILNHLMDRHSEDFEDHKRESLLRSLERHVVRFHEEQGTCLQKRRTKTQNPNIPGPRNLPLSKYWKPEIVPLLERHPDGSIKPAGILNDLWDRHPKDFEDYKWKSLLRSLERHVVRFYKGQGTCLQKRRTKTQNRKPRCQAWVLMLAQEHPPGREVQVDLTHCDLLEVTIQGEPFTHQLFDFRMSHSGWTYMEVALGETVAALMQGLQHAFRELGGVPQVVRKDRHSSAIHKGKPVQPFAAFLRHYELELSLINAGRPWENGGVEQNNGRVKTNLEQALLIRENRDFDSKDDYETFVRRVVNWNNRRSEVQQKLEEERAGLRPLPASPAPEYAEVERKVSDYGIINLYGCQYSVPCVALRDSRHVKVHLYADRVKVYSLVADPLVADPLVNWTRLHETNGVRIHYSHLFPDILRKSHGFIGLREDIKVHMFPQESFKQAYNKLKEWAAEDMENRKDMKDRPVKAYREISAMNADYEYLRILGLAAIAKREDAVDQALKLLLESGRRFGYEDVKREIPPASDYEDWFTGQPTLR